jgi:DNA polymerase I-like protein with 3'-5' exonuclease and polymerase domains
MPSEWQSPRELPDLRRVGIIGLDCETKDEGLHAKRGPGWPWRGGYITGISVAWHADGAIRAIYIPLHHPDSQNFSREQVIRWLRDLIASGVKIITKNGLYDWGWLWADLGIEMLPAEQLEEIDALATMVDENRLRYCLDALCAWRGFPGKDESLLVEGCAALGLIPARKRKSFKPQSVLWQLPAHLVGPYAETDAVRTLELFESLNPVLDREGTRDAYRLEIDLLPMVHRMRQRGVRVDISAAEQRRKALLHKRDTVLAQISEKLEASVGMDEINGRKWLIGTFDRLGIKYPLTEKGNPSFKRGKRGWMQHSEHWLPPLIATADQLDQYGNNFLRQQILGHIENGRVYGEIHPHRSDYGGTRSLRFSYSHPPLQQMPKHDEELAPLIRSVFLPEEDETWASCDYSQQEFRLVVHYAARKNLRGALAARDRYISDPDFDIHAYASELTGGVITRQDGKTFNFMTIYGAGPETTSHQVKKSLSETKSLLALYNEKMPFISQLANACKNVAHRDGTFTLFNRARRHFNLWFPGGRWEEGAGPCERREAERRVHDPGHPWYGRQLWRAETFKALNVLIQSSAAIQTKEWMRACYREDIVPLLQMHDSLDLSVASPDVAEMVARLGEDVVKLEVPMKVDVKYGRTWGDAKHTWAELHAETGLHVELVGEIPGDQERAPREQHAPKQAPVSDGFDNFGDTAVTCIGHIRCQNPDHDDKEPSCALYSDGHYYCFGCRQCGWIDEDLDLSDATLATIIKTANSDTRTLERGLKLWDDGTPIANTLAERYLTEARKLDLAVLPAGIDEVLRFHPHCPFGSNGTRHPCLLALFRDVELDTPAGIHRIGLTPEGAKIVMQMPRRTLGRWPSSRAIKLWSATTTLVIGEGVETVLAAIRRGVVSSPAWAMGSRINIAKLPVLPGIATLTILVDNDANAPADAETCAARWTAAGRSVRALRTKHVKDFNDLVMA